MKKELFVICIIVAAFGAQAQTFQRKTRQPAFFMPQSALSTQQAEKLPAIETMNYQGQRAPSVQMQPSSPQFENKAAQNPFKTAETKSATEVKDNLAPKAQIKDTAPLPTPSQNELKEDSRKNPEVKTTDTENYQSVFAEILGEHKNDIFRIGKGGTAENPKINAVIEAFQPKIHSLSFEIDPKK